MSREAGDFVNRGVKQCQNAHQQRLNERRVVLLELRLVHPRHQMLVPVVMVTACYLFNISQWTLSERK